MSDDALNNDVENPMATDGFEFVEYGSPDPQALARHFEAMGFTATHPGLRPGRRTLEVGPRALSP